MSQTAFIVLLVGLIGALGGVLLVFLTGRSRSATVSAQMRNLGSQTSKGELGSSLSQRQSGDISDKVLPQKKQTSSALTLEKKLKYAQWKISPLVFRLALILISLIVLTVVNQFFHPVVQAFSLFSGPLVMNWAINRAVSKRFMAFDSDYPQMLLSLVGLLKTGMNPLQALESAAKALDEGSLVRSEVEAMMLRVRYGVPEEKSIGAFGEDIFHPEIELFVQALLLSQRVGGGALSNTLDRLAKQVRKRQYFRMSAQAAIGMQKGSIWFIVAILAALEVYLYFVYPQAIVDSVNDPTGWLVWQAGGILIALGIFWISQVTKMKI
jgi:tight adherence protein B